ncbi:MAG: MotA/TolQ/ExbB proton channel family protein [Bacteroidales bacterium]|nr:MotA/TolQ/ExbB proton channel family protein [Bacteroidales bacterium]
MKKIIALFAIAGCLTFGMSNAFAQDKNAPAEAPGQEQVDADEDEQAAEAETPAEEQVVEVAKPFNQVLKDKFIDGGPGWMTPILIVLILGLALVIERTIYLNLATTNTSKLLNDIEAALDKGDVEKAKEVCRNTRGPVASVFYQGLLRYNGSIDEIEKAVVSYGGVQTARLETNMSWLAFCIAVAPSLGFLGTVVGMVQAFDDIETAGDISPTIVAGGMKVALITTVTGLIVAIILQVFYSYLISKVDSLMNSMEDSTITFMDIVVKNKK